MLLALGTTDSQKLERVQRKFLALRKIIIFQDVQYSRDNLLGKLNLLTLYEYIGRRYSDSLFVIVYKGVKFCSSLQETIAFRVPVRYIRKCTMLGCSSSHCPSARRASAANAECKSTDIFRNLRLNVNNLHWFIFYFVLVFVSLLLYFIRADSVICH
jgi:hypothetical protein